MHDDTLEAIVISWEDRVVKIKISGYEEEKKGCRKRDSCERGF